MSTSPARAVMRMELLGLLRDRRALFTALVLPFLLFPALLFAATRLQEIGRASLAARELTLAVDLDALPETRRTAVSERLEGLPHTTLAEAIDADLDPPPTLDDGSRERLRTAIAAGGARALLVAREGGSAAIERSTLVLYHDGANEAASELARRVEDALRPLREELLAARIESLLGSDPATAFASERVDLAAPADARGARIGALAPLLLVFIALAGGSLAALAAFAGEREHGTLETLLVQPLSARSIVRGKLAAIVVATLATTTANAAAFQFAARIVPGEVVELSGIPWLRWLVAAAVFSPALLQLCAALAWISARAQSFKEGQHALLPLNLLAALPAALALDGNAAADTLLGALPIAGPAIALREALSGTLSAGAAAFVLASGAAWVALGMRAVARALEGERWLAANDVGTARQEARRARLGATLTVLTVYIVGGHLQARAMLAGLVVTLAGILPLAAVLLARGTTTQRAAGFAAAMGLTRPRLAHLAGALLLAAPLALAARSLTAAQARWLPLPRALQDSFAGFEQLLDLPLPQLLLLLAVLPAIGEELFFRGALLEAQRRGSGRGALLAQQALFFALAHALIFRMPLTALLGIVLAALTLRARSVWPAMLAHAGFNGLQVAFAAEELPYSLGGALALATLAAGAFLVPPRESWDRALPDSAAAA